MDYSFEPYESENSTPSFCVNYGERVDISWKYCPYCRKKIAGKSCTYVKYTGRAECLRVIIGLLAFGGLILACMCSNRDSTIKYLREARNEKIEGLEAENENLNYVISEWEDEAENWENEAYEYEHYYELAKNDVIRLQRISPLSWITIAIIIIRIRVTASKTVTRFGHIISKPPVRRGIMRTMPVVIASINRIGVYVDSQDNVKGCVYFESFRKRNG